MPPVIICCTFVKKDVNMETLYVQSAGWIGTPEIIIIVVVILLLFGGRKIPELMRGLGKGIKEFKEGVSEDTTDNGDNKKTQTDSK